LEEVYVETGPQASHDLCNFRRWEHGEDAHSIFYSGFRQPRHAEFDVTEFNPYLFFLALSFWPGGVAWTQTVRLSKGLRCSPRREVIPRRTPCCVRGFRSRDWLEVDNKVVDERMTRNKPVVVLLQTF
jgi:hypothetical protein